MLTNFSIPLLFYFNSNLYFREMIDYLITVNDEEIQVNTTEAKALDRIQLSPLKHHVLQSGTAYNVEVVAEDFLNKSLSISVNGNVYRIKIEDEKDQLVKEMGLFAVTSQKVNSIKAPMPGLILDIMVEVGQEIIEGTPLLVLSAMKMENIILSQGEGVVKAIAVHKDDAVDKGQLIIEME